MKKILFRADAAPHIGIGDLMSLINISKYFDDTIEICFIIKNYEAGLRLIKSYEVEEYTTVIDQNITIEDEVNFINQFIKENKIDLIFFEITERALFDYQSITSTVKKVAVNFDGKIPDNLDLVIDWDVEADKYFTPKEYPNTKFLLGPEYVILPQEFYSAKVKNKTDNVGIPKVLIAMGGADELDFTSKVVDSIINLNLNYELNIIVGSGYQAKKSLEAKLSNSSLKYEIKQNVTNMIDEYLSCSIGIGAGGLTSSEMVAAKISPILIATYEHQVARCKYFDKMGWAKYLGYREFDDNILEKAILNPINNTDKSIFNTFRIVELINEI